MTRSVFEALQAEISAVPVVCRVGRVAELARNLLEVSGLARVTALSDRVEIQGRSGALGGEVLRMTPDRVTVLADGGADGFEIGDAVTLAGKAEIARRRLRVVALDLPTSWQMLEASRDDIHGRMLEAINGMMLDMLAAIARKDYEDRRRRQAQGVANAKAEGRYRGRPEDTKRNAALMKMLKDGQSWASIVDATGASRSTLAKLSKRLKEEDESGADPSRASGTPDRIAS